MTLNLHPAELGTVQIHISHTPDGSARVDVTAEKTGTLQALLRDQPQLHRALDDAGVPAAGRTITFHAAQPATAPAGSGGLAFQAPSQSSSSTAGGTGTSAGGNTPNGTGPQGGGKSGYPGSETGNDPAGRRQTPSSEAVTGPAGISSYRIGVDIIA
jgi:hypothetical protein